MKYPEWTDFTIEETTYGFHQFGLGVYRFDPETQKPTHFWLDPEASLPEEVECYNKYLEQNGFEVKKNG